MTQKDNGGHDDLACDSYVYPGDRYARSGVKSGHGMGITLRDWFAGQALAGISAHQGSGRLTVDEIVIKAYVFADAMLAARGKQ